MICRECGEEKSFYKNKYGMCQKCYRKMLEKYSYYDYKDTNVRLKGMSKRVCELAINSDMELKEIAEFLNLNANYVRQITNKYLVKCDSYGNLKPKGINE